MSLHLLGQFNWRLISKMMELNALLMAAIEEHPEMPTDERGNLLGECDLFLSEGSVKQYVNQIYSKLHIEGDTRTKRKQLAELVSQNT